MAEGFELGGGEELNNPEYYAILMTLYWFKLLLSLDYFRF